MTNTNNVRRAHELVDAIGDGRILSSSDVGFLRSFLPEMPKQKTLEEITDDVYKAWIASSGDEWVRDGITGSVISLEDWLTELHTQLKGLKDMPVSVPALPAGMRLAEHEDYGRVVAAPIADSDGGRMIFCLDKTSLTGAGRCWAHEDSLTFIAAEPDKSAHPEFLETEADYQKAPEGTVVVKVDALPWVKEDGNIWTCAGGSKGDYGMSLVGSRRVLRWGWGE